MPSKTVFFHSLIHSFSHVFYTPEHDGINNQKSAPKTKPLYIAMTSPSFPLTILPANTTHLYYSFYLLPSPVKLLIFFYDQNSKKY
jgi:hypothetical protein